MASVTFQRKEVEKHLKLNQEVIEKIHAMGISSELTDETLTIEVLANRPDLMSIQGFLRAYNAYYGKKQGLVEYQIKPSGAKIIVDKSVEKIRPFSMAAIVKGLHFDDEMIKNIVQWQEKIHGTAGRNRRKAAIGFYVLDKIKFPVQYTTKTPKEIVFTPLDTQEKMNATQILTKHPTGREYGAQLEGFDKFPVYIDANKEVLSMPPIINSNNSGKIMPGTKDILIEASGTDLAILKKIITIAVVDLVDLGGKAFSVDIVYGNKIEKIDCASTFTKISLENVNKLLGLELKEKDIEKLLPKMGHEYKAEKVYSPTYRTDILHEVDIIEDIAIAYGYDNMVPEIPTVATTGQESHSSKIQSKIANILTGLGMLEIASYHLIKEEEAKLFNVQNKIETENAKTDYKVVRPNLLIPALRILAENKDNEYPQRIFEIGTVFAKSDKTETGIQESTNLLIAVTPANITELEQIFDYLTRMLNIKYAIVETENERLIEGRSGLIKLGNQSIGYLGELHPETLKAWNIKMPVAVIEISLDPVIHLLKSG